MATKDAPGKQKATHHLTNMKVKEVSFVRQGANGRNKFLLAKTAEDETQAPAGTGVQPDAPSADATDAPHEPPPVVIKGDITLVDGESLEEFKCDLCEALCKLLNPGAIQGRDVWLRAVYADRVVAQQGWGAEEKLLALPYTREGEDFKFGDATVVGEVCTYEPARNDGSAAPPPAPLATAAKDAQSPADSATSTTTGPPPAAEPVAPEAQATTAPAPTAPAEVDKAVQQHLKLQRRVWDLIHQTLDAILASSVSAPPPDGKEPTTDSGQVAEPEKSQPAVPPSGTVEVKLPDALQKALEQVPALAAELAQVKATVTGFAKERGGSQALPVDAPPAAAPTAGESEDWRTCTDFNAWREKHAKSRR